MNSTTPAKGSTWIDSVAYRNGFLAVFLKRDTDQPEALLYAGVAPWMKGLILAGLGGRSVGRAYNKLVKGKGLQYQRVVGHDRVKRLKEMMQ